MKNTKLTRTEYAVMKIAEAEHTEARLEILDHLLGEITDSSNDFEQADRAYRLAFVAKTSRDAYETDSGDDTDGVYTRLIRTAAYYYREATDNIHDEIQF